jgi:hypothetical protein
LLIAILAATLRAGTLAARDDAGPAAPGGCGNSPNQVTPVPVRGITLQGDTVISSAATKVLRHIAPARADESYANTMRQIREDAQTLSREASGSREELELR